MIFSMAPLVSYVIKFSWKRRSSEVENPCPISRELCPKTTRGNGPCPSRCGEAKVSATILLPSGSVAVIWTSCAYAKHSSRGCRQKCPIPDQNLPECIFFSSLPFLEKMKFCYCIEPHPSCIKNEVSFASGLNGRQVLFLVRKPSVPSEMFW